MSALMGVVALALAVAMLRAAPIEAHRADAPSGGVVYLVVDASTGRLLDARWPDPERPLPLGSLIKPFVALAYAGTHDLTYPTATCHGHVDGCWLPAGHGRIGIVSATALSCNAYFLRLAERTAPRDLSATLSWFGITAHAPVMTPASMVGLGDGVKLSPIALARGYLELVSRFTQREVAPIVEGMKASARTGTGRALGAALGHGDALVKTGTAPCVHAPTAAGDGYTLAVYPADRPRVVLLVQAHGRTGADTAGLAGVLLRDVVEVR